MNFSVYLQHNSSVLSSYIWFAFWSVQCSAPLKSLAAIQHFNCFFQKLSTICCWKLFRVFECSFRNDNIRFSFPCTSCIISYHARQILTCAISVVCLKEGKISQKHNCKYMANWWCLLVMENYMFRPIAAVIRFSQLCC
jgi:hypothetical protein